MTSSRKENIFEKNYYAIISGFFASSASLFGKLIGNINIEKPNSSEWNIFNNIWIIRSICIGFMILCNTFVWTFYVKALHNSGGTLIATVISAASNYIISFIFGTIIFNEKISSYSIIGLMLILIGLIFINKK